MRPRFLERLAAAARAAAGELRAPAAGHQPSVALALRGVPAAARAALAGADVAQPLAPAQTEVAITTDVAAIAAELHEAREAIRDHLVSLQIHLQELPRFALERADAEPQETIALDDIARSSGPAPGRAELLEERYRQKVSVCTECGRWNYHLVSCSLWEAP